MSYTITLSNGTPLTTIYDRTEDESTSLSLVGRGSVLFGAAVTENIVHLLENFSNNAAPLRPITGQLWYDTSVSLLKIYNTATSSWVVVSDNGVFGLTGQLAQGQLINGSQSTPERISGTIGVVLTGGLGQTTVAVTLAEGVIISATSNYNIPFLSLPLTVQINGTNIGFSGNFPQGLVPGINLATLPYQVVFAGSGIAEIISGTDPDGSEYEEEIQGLYTAVNGNQAAISQESLTRANAISALAQTVTNITATSNTGNVAAILQEATARADADSALADTLTTLNASLGTTNANITNEQTARVAQGNSLALAISTLAVNVGSNASTITQEATTRAAGDSTNAALITALTSSVGANTSAIQTEASTRASYDDVLTKNAIVISASANRQRVYFQSTPPSGNTDSVWFNTNDGNKPYQWNGTSWVPAQDSGIATNAAAIMTEQQTRITSEAAIASQITALVTAVNNSIASYESSDTAGSTDYTSFTNAIQLLAASTNQNTSAITQEANTRSNADGAISLTLAAVGSSANRQRVFFQSTPPTGATDAVWFNLADGNKPYMWDGTIWAPAQDGGIATVAAAVTSETSSRTTADTALGSRIDALTATVAGATANITTQANVSAAANAVAASTRQALAATTNQTTTWFQSTTPTYSMMFPAGVNSHPDCVPLTSGQFVSSASDGGSLSSFINDGVISNLSGANTLIVKTADQRVFPSGNVIDTYITIPPFLTAGTIYEFSAYVGASNCYSILILAFLDANNNTLTTFNSTTVGQGGEFNGGTVQGDGSHPGGASISGYGRVWTYGLAPVGTASAVLYLRLDGTGQANPYIIGQRFYFGQLPSGQTVPSDYVPTSNNQLWLNTADNNSVYRYTLKTGLWFQAADQRIAQNIAAISNESNIRLTGDNALASQISSLSATIDNNSANITNNAQVASDNLSSLAQQVNTVSASASKQRVYFQPTAPTGSTDAVWFNTADGNKPYAWNGTIWTPKQDTGIATATAAVTAESVARASGDTSLANQINALTATTNQLSATITTNAQVASTANTTLAQTITTVSAAANAQRVYFGTATPPGAIDAVWFNQNDNNSPYKWNPTTQTWQSRVDAGIGIVSANLLTETTARTNAFNSLSSQITQLGATFNTSNASLTAAITNESTTRANANNAFAQQLSSLTSTVNNNSASASSSISTLTTGYSSVASQVTSLSSTVGGNSASITNLTTAYNGIAASYSVTGYINGQTGGFEFQGVARADGQGAVFTTTFDSNVIINGSLLVNGTVASDKIGLNQLVAVNTAFRYASQVNYVIASWGLSQYSFSSSGFDGQTFYVGGGEGGLYLVEACIQFNANVEEASVGVQLNGSPVNITQQGQAGNYFNWINCLAFFYCNPGDYINISTYMQTQSGQARSVVPGTRLGITRLGV